MTAKEEQTDSDQPETIDIGIFNTLRAEYTKLAIHHLRLRKAIFEDLSWIKESIKHAKEVSRSNSIEIMEIVIDYIEEANKVVREAIEKLEEDLKPFSEMIDKRERLTGKEIEESSARLL